MNDNEKELIRIIRESEDPAKAMLTAIEIICQHIPQGKISPANADSLHTQYHGIHGTKL